MDIYSSTSPLSQMLISRLRLIFEPTKANKFKGDYKTGKRLNMRKIIPYIASDFRKDKIWLKRTKVAKRDYHILLALDDSSSMKYNEAGTMALESLATVSSALNVIDVGKLGILKFGATASLIQPFKSFLSNDDGGKIIEEFSFAQDKTSLIRLLKLAVETFEREKLTGETGKISQLLVIISDGKGVFQEGKEKVLDEIRAAENSHIFVVFVIVEAKEDGKSVLDIKYPIFDAKNKSVKFETYMENFPFPYYILLKKLKTLPLVLCDALQQWFHLCNIDN